MVELVDEADLVAADRGALVVGQPPAGAAGDDDLAGVGPLEQAGDVQQRRLAGAGRRDQRHHLAAATARGRRRSASSACAAPWT